MESATLSSLLLVGLSLHQYRKQRRRGKHHPRAWAESSAIANGSRQGYDTVKQPECPRISEIRRLRRWRHSEAENYDDAVQCGVLPGHSTHACTDDTGRCTSEKEQCGALDAPSFLVSQNAAAAVCNPAPFFCIIVHVTALAKQKCR